MTAHRLHRSRCTADLRWAHHTLQGPAATPAPGDQASLLSALGPSAWPHSAPPPRAAEGSALKCCSDPSSSSGAHIRTQALASSLPRPRPYLQDCSGLTPNGSLRLQALALKATPARSLRQAPAHSEHGSLASPARQPTPSPCCLHAKGPGPPGLPIVTTQRADLAWVPASPPPRAWHGMGYGGASIMEAGEGLERVRGLGGSQGHSSSERAQSSRPMLHSLPPGRWGRVGNGLQVKAGGQGWQAVAVTGL